MAVQDTRTVANIPLDSRLAFDVPGFVRDGAVFGKASPRKAPLCQRGATRSSIHVSRSVREARSPGPLTRVGETPTMTSSESPPLRAAVMSVVTVSMCVDVGSKYSGDSPESVSKSHIAMLPGDTDASGPGQRLRDVPMSVNAPTRSSREEHGFALRLADVRQRVNSACQRVERRADDIRLLPVSKTVLPERLRPAIAAGCIEFGENRVQEAMEKAFALRGLGLRWSIIGHLQSNKAKQVARFAHELQSLDSLKLARLLERHLQSQGRALDVFVQVDSTEEGARYGLPPDSVPAFVAALAPFETLRLRGLMTLALFSSEEVRVRACFRRMRVLHERLRQEVRDPERCAELSMGMSGDFQTAIEEGATVIRVGQALFGPRPLPDSHYWPDIER